MNTHDKYELPPLPTIDVMGKTSPQIWFTAAEVDVLRHAAIEAYAQRIAELEAKHKHQSTLARAKNAQVADFLGGNHDNQD